MNKVIKVGFLAATVTSLVGCAAPLAINKDAAVQRFGECVAREAPALDDGISDARTVGAAAASACHAEADAMTQAYTVGMSPAGRETYRSRLKGLTVDLATRTVLSIRAARR